MLGIAHLRSGEVSLQMEKIKSAPNFLAAMALLILFLIFALSFSTKQNLWVDESTQLSGLTLSVIDIYLWLGDFIEHPFLVPPDRMPVLSYWVGKCWIFFTNDDVLTQRWLSILLVGTGICFLGGYFYLNKMYAASLSIMLFLCLSPNLVVYSVEIRSYALFFLLSTIVSILFFDIVRRKEVCRNGLESRLVYLAIMLGLAINTHIFGLLLCGSVVSTYILLMFLDKRFQVGFRSILKALLILLVSIVLVAPSIYGSLKVTNEGNNGSGDASLILGLVKLFYRLVAHQTMLEFYIVPIIVMIVFYGVIALSLFKNRSLPNWTILIVLIQGLIVASLAKVFMQGFNSLSISYNLWMFPFLAILFGMSMQQLKYVKLKSIVVIFIVFAFVYGQHELFVSGEKYAHTRFSDIEAKALKYSNDLPVAIVYNKNMAKTWFAGIYKFRNDAIGQYIYDGDTQGYKNIVSNEDVSYEKIASNYNVIISVYGEDKFSNQLIRLPVSGTLTPQSLALKQIQLPETMWKIEDAISLNAQESADIVVFVKNAQNFPG